MGMRPATVFVCGINDAKNNDARYSHDDDSAEGKVPRAEEHLFDTYDTYFDEVYISGSPSSGLDCFPVAGYVIARGNEDLSRGLIMAFNWDYNNNIIVINPCNIPGKLTQQAYIMRDGIRAVEAIIKENRWFSQITPFYTDLYLRRALYLLHLGGWIGVTRDMLKFMLGFYWA